MRRPMIFCFPRGWKVRRPMIFYFPRGWKVRRPMIFCFPRGWRVRRQMIFYFPRGWKGRRPMDLIKNVVGKVHDKCPLRSEEEGRGQCVCGCFSAGVSMSGASVAAFRHGLPWANGVISA